MDRFVDIRLLPDAEFPATILMNAVFSKLHRALVSVPRNIGVSFPRAEKTLGDVLRLHGEEGPLSELMAQDWIAGLRDYVQISHIGWVPRSCQYRVIRRVQPKDSAARTRRLASRSGRGVADVGEETRSARLSCPFLRVRSSSTSQVFPLFIDQETIVDEPRPGSFSKYGLSAEATVPWF